MPYSDPEAIREYQRQYRQRTKGARKMARPNYDRARHANQRAKMYGATGVLTVADIRATLDGSPCHYCGTTERIGIDHVIPLHRQGANSRENIVPCCDSCNKSKWRQDRPGRWSRAYDACIDCGTTERKHIAHGRCATCHSRYRRSAR